MRQTAILEFQQIDNHRLPTHKMLKDLASFANEEEQAFSFYFSLDHFADKSPRNIARQMDRMVARLEGSVASHGGRPAPELGELLSIRQRVLADPGAFHIALFCPSSNTHLGISIPAREHMQYLSAGYV